MPEIQFSVEDLKTPDSLERVLRQMIREIAPVKLPDKPPTAAELAAALAPLIRDELQANGIAPLNLQSLLPQTGISSFIEDTHANRLTLYTPPTTVGVGFVETDRHVLYVSEYVSGVLVWVFVAGVYVATFASRPADLTTNDPGFLFFATDQDTIFIWTGSTWNTTSKRILFGSNYIIFAATLTGDRTYTFSDESGNFVYDTAALTDHAIVLGSGGANKVKAGTLGTTTTVLHGNAAGDPSYAAVNLATDTTGTTAVANGGTGATVAPARTASSPSDPTGTASTTGVMMGLAGAITPTVSGAVVITITGTIQNDTNGDGAQAQIRYGTGSAPANGDALTGTTAGVYKGINTVGAGNPKRVPFALSFLVTGLSVSTAHWIDVGLKAITGGTANIFDIDIVAIEHNV